MSSEDPRERDDLCGRELVAERGGEDLAEEYDPDIWYEAEDGTHYCRREVWDGADTDQCIWHADVEDKPVDELAAARSEGQARLDRAVLRESDLRDGLSLSECRLCDADLGGAELRGAHLIDALLVGADLGGANLPNANLAHADLSNADLSDANLMNVNCVATYIYNGNLNRTYSAGADFSEANLEESRLSDAMLRGADLTDAIIERVDFTRANLFDAHLSGSMLYGAVLANVQLNTDTTFGSHYTDESDDSHPEKAAWTLRQLERLFRENALPERARDAYLDRKDRRRRQYWDEGDYGRALLATGYGATMRYGESPWRVVGISVATVLLGATLYPLWGMKVGKAGEAVTTISYPFETVGVVTGLGKSLYLSVITFTTLGYGDVQPLGFGEAVATVESFVGALLMALLVFVLGRRATW